MNDQLNDPLHDELDLKPRLKPSTAKRTTCALVTDSDPHRTRNFQAR